MPFLFLFYLFVLKGLILEVRAQTLYGIDVYPALSDEDVSASISFKPVATGTDGVTTWMAQEVVSYDVFTYAQTTETVVAPSAPTTLSYTFIPTPGGLKAALGTPEITTASSGATFALQQDLLSCTFDGSGIGVCAQFAEFLSGTVTSVGTAQLAPAAVTLSAIPIFTLGVSSGSLTTARIAGIATGAAVSLVSLLVAGLWICLRRRRSQARGSHRRVVSVEEAETSAIPLTHASWPGPADSRSQSTATGSTLTLAFDNATSLERGAVESQDMAMQKVSLNQRPLAQEPSNTRVSDVVEQMRAMAERMAVMEARINAAQRAGGSDGFSESPPEYTRAV